MNRRTYMIVVLMVIQVKSHEFIAKHLISNISSLLGIFLLKYSILSLSMLHIILLLFYIS